MASIAPAAPSVWPSIDLLAVTATRGAWSPKIVWIDCSSALSPSGVDVAWALTWSISAGSMPAFSSARWAARTAPMPPGRRQRDVRRVRGRPVAHELGQRRRAARLGVLEGLEDQRPAALAHHEPVAGLVERPRGRLRDRRCGPTGPSSRRSRPASPRGCRPRRRRRSSGRRRRAGSSPTTRPARGRRSRTPTPSRSWGRARRRRSRPGPAPTFAMPIGMKNGEIRSGPRSAMTSTLSNSVDTPPRPEPMITPDRAAMSSSRRGGRPAWTSAWLAHTRANWM